MAVGTLVGVAVGSGVDVGAGVSVGGTTIGVGVKVGMGSGVDGAGVKVGIGVDGVPASLAGVAMGWSLPQPARTKANQTSAKTALNPFDIEVFFISNPVG